MITKERIWEQQRLNRTDKNHFKFHCMRSFHSWKCHHFPRDSICMHDIFLTIQRLASQKRICLTEEKKRAAKNNHPDIHVLFVLYFVVLKKTVCRVTTGAHLPYYIAKSVFSSFCTLEYSSRFNR